MQFFRNLSVRAKLFGGFGVVLLVAVVTGVVLITQIGTVNAGGVYLGTNALPSVEGIGIIDASAGDYRQNQLRYVLEPDKAQMQTAVAGWKAADAKIEKALSEYQKSFTNATDRQEWASVKSGWEAYKAKTANIQTVGLNGVNAASLAAVRNSQPSFEALSSAIDKWRAENIKWANEKLNSNASTYHTARTLGIVLLLIAVAVGLAIAFMMSQSIKHAVDLVLDRLSSLRDHCAANLKAGLEGWPTAI